MSWQCFLLACHLVCNVFFVESFLQLESHLVEGSLRNWVCCRFYIHISSAVLLLRYIEIQKKKNPSGATGNRWLDESENCPEFLLVQFITKLL